MVDIETMTLETPTMRALVQHVSSGMSISSYNFKEYTFTVDDLPEFRTYRIKLILTSTSQVHVPRVRNLRVIALA